MQYQTGSSPRQSSAGYHRLDSVNIFSKIHESTDRTRHQNVEKQELNIVT